MRLSVLWLLCLVTAAAAGQPAPEPVEFVRSDEFSEGPLFDYDGAFYFTHGRFVSRVSPGGDVSVWAETTGANGHKVLPDGTHLLCVPGDRAVLRLSASGAVLGTASAECGGRPLRAPNDLTLDDHGGFYFTDPGGSREAPIGTVQYVGADGVTSLAAEGLRVPNGLVLSRDGRILYLAETVPNRILSFPVLAPGRLGEPKVFAELPRRPGHQAEPDGMALDSDGNVYVAHLGMSAVQVLTPEGNLLRTLPAGNYDASNLAFDPRRPGDLYVTGSVGHRSRTAGRVYRLTLPGVSGVPSLLERRPSAP